MYALCRILSPPAALAAAVLLFAACNAETATRPAIPTIDAAYAGPGGERWCSEWSCSYDTCHLRPDWDGGSCCVEYTVDPSQEAQRPGYCAQPKPIGGGGDCGPGTYGSCQIEYAGYCHPACSCCYH